MPYVTKALFATTALLLAIHAHAAPDDVRDARAKAAFDQVAGGRLYHLRSSTFGDLDGDGIPDFATFAGDPLYNENGIEDLQVLVFKGRADGGFDLLARSGAILGNGRVSHAVTIARGSLFLHRDGSDGCCGHWVEEFQFKQRDGQLMLIGVESSDVHPDGIHQDDEGSSVNLATGQSEHWLGSGKHVRRQRRKVPGLKPIPLAGFDYEKFTSAWPGL